MAELDGSVTISSFSTDDIANYKQLPDMGGGNTRTDTQLARVFCTATASGTPAGSGVLRFKLVKNDNATCVGMVEAAVSISTAATVARATAGAGEYVLTVTFPNGTDTLDLNGVTAFKNYTWWVGSPAAAMTNVTSMTLNFSKTAVT